MRKSAILAAALVLGALSGCAVRQRVAPIPGLALSQDYEARRASSWNHLGPNKDWYEIPAGETVALAELEGPGMVTHLWFTVRPDGLPSYLDDLWLILTWEGAEEPAVEMPFGSFFGMGHGRCRDFLSEPIVVFRAAKELFSDEVGRGSFNCYFPMPFREKAELAIRNEGDAPILSLFFHVDYRVYDALPADARYFHAQYCQERTRPANSPAREENYVILERDGRGHYVGCVLHTEAHPEEAGKWYEGDEIILVDGREGTALRGTGTEDYFGMSWGVRRWFQAPLFGTSYHAWHEGEPTLRHWGSFSQYRWHLPDPVPFEESIHVSIEHGHHNDAANLYRSTAYWYEDAP